MTEPKQTTSPVSASIEEGLFVDINGQEQWVTIRGQDRDNPAVLLLPGAGAGMSVMAPVFVPWERFFTLVQWDQPHAGVTHARHGAAGVEDFSYDRIVRDGSAVIQAVRHRLRVPKVAVLAFSAGTVVGLRLVKQHPQQISAYIGVGQVVNWARQDALSYELLLQRARASADNEAIAELEEIGAPPYLDAATDARKAKYSVAFTPAESAAFGALGPVILGALSAPPQGASYIPAGFVPDPDPRAVATAAYTRVREQVMSFDADDLGLAFDVPMFFFQGEQDLCTVTSEVQAYEKRIRAARKELVIIEGGGHSPWLMRDRFLELLVRHVRPVLVSH